MNIFVRNLSYSVDSQALGMLFGEFGQLKSAKVIMDYTTKRSKGFGFVEFFEESAGQTAIEALNEKEFEGRKIYVSVAKPRPETHRQEEK